MLQSILGLLRNHEGWVNNDSETLAVAQLPPAEACRDRFMVLTRHGFRV